jgi:Zc3h12a-like Ribonuclease NYN domain
MVVSLLLLALSVLGAGLSVWVYGVVLSIPLLACITVAFIALILFLFQTRQVPQRYVVVDGSNVMHWKNDQPCIATLRSVLRELIENGFVPVVWFDANVGYKISDRYLGPHSLAKLLGVPAQQILVAPKGTPADPLLLDCATQLRAKVVTNDQFRDWTESHPQMKEPGFLVAGGFRGGKVVLGSLA